MVPIYAAIKLERTLPRWVRPSWSFLVSQPSKQKAHINSTHDVDKRVVVRLDSALDRLNGRQSLNNRKVDVSRFDP